MRIGFDLDGVLADFCSDFQKVLAQVTDGTLRRFPQGHPTVWDWPQEELGYTNEEVSRAWAKVTQPTSRFWLGHATFDIPGMEAVADLSYSNDHALYFITDRGGKAAYANAKWQTEVWLSGRDVRRPTVLIAKDKGAAAKALSLDFMVDDRPENLFAVYTDSPDTRRYLIAAEYNRWAWGDQRVIPVRDVETVFKVEGL